MASEIIKVERKLRKNSQTISPASSVPSNKWSFSAPIISTTKLASLAAKVSSMPGGSAGRICPSTRSITAWLSATVLLLATRTMPTSTAGLPLKRVRLRKSPSPSITRATSARRMAPPPRQATTRSCSARTDLNSRSRFTSNSAGPLTTVPPGCCRCSRPKADFTSAGVRL